MCIPGRECPYTCTRVYICTGTDIRVPGYTRMRGIRSKNHESSRGGNSLPVVPLFTQRLSRRRGPPPPGRSVSSGWGGMEVRILVSDWGQIWFVCDHNFGTTILCCWGHFQAHRTPCLPPPWTTLLVGEPCGYRRCPRITYVHPFCAYHARRVLGVEVRPSPVHGRGLFATRPFRYGDVIVPYVGERFPNEVAALRGRPLSPFAFRLRLGPAGIHYDDATSLRGYAACVNSPPAGTPANAVARRSGPSDSPGWVSQPVFFLLPEGPAIRPP